MSNEPTPPPALEELFYRVERVRFLYWNRFSGAKATVALVAIIALMSFITGLSTLSQEAIALEGPLAPLLPEVEAIVRFGGVISAFLLIGVTLGLRRRKRVAWYVGLVVLPLIALLPVITLQSTHIPILLLCLIAIPMLIFNQSHFVETIDLTSLQLASIASIVGVLAYGTIGAYAIRDQFVELETWTDAFYFVLVTIATVGYGDMTPVTAQARWFSLSVIILGVGAFTTAIGALIVPAIEKRMASAVGTMTGSNLTLLEDHVIILGYSDIMRAVIDALSGEIDLVIVTGDASVASRIEGEDVQVFNADPTDAQSLREAGVDHARGVIVGTRDDAQDVLAVLATREVNPDVRIVAAANQAHNAAKLEVVGADHVISPSKIGGQLLGRAVLAADDEEALEAVIGNFATSDAEGSSS